MLLSCVRSSSMLIVILTPSRRGDRQTGTLRLLAIIFAFSLADRSGGRLVQPTFGNIRLSLDVVTWNSPRTWPTSWAVSHRALLWTMAAPGFPLGWVAQPSRLPDPPTRVC